MRESWDTGYEWEIRTFKVYEMLKNERLKKKLKEWMVEYEIIAMEMGKMNLMV